MTEVKTEAPRTKDARLKVVAQLAKQLEKEFKEPTLLRMGDKVGVPMPHRATGLAVLDWEVIQIGGLPKGRIIEIYGPESAGKTTLALQIVAEAQSQGLVAAYIDAEHALDPTWASTLGADVENLFINQPESAEQALQILDKIIDTEAVDIIVIDSVAALAPQAELDGEIGDAHVGLLPRLMGQTMRKIANKLNRLQNRPTVIFLNQIREKIGVMYGNPETQPGGRALKFYASVRLDVRKSEWIKEGDVVVGSKIKIKAIKNKCASPFKECFVNLSFGKTSPAGFDKIGSWLDVAFDRGIVAPQGGTTFYFKKEKVAVGKEAAKTEIRSNPKLLAAIQEEVKQFIQNQGAPAV